MARENDGAFVIEQRGRERFDGVDVQMVAGFVENQDVVFVQQNSGHAESGAFASGKYGDFLFNRRPLEQHCAGNLQNRLHRRSRQCVVIKIALHGFVWRKCRVDVLRVRADVTAVTPFHVAGNRGE